MQNSAADHKLELTEYFLRASNNHTGFTKRMLMFRELESVKTISSIAILPITIANIE